MGWDNTGRNITHRCPKCGGKFIQMESNHSEYGGIYVSGSSCIICNIKHEHFPEIYTAKWIQQYGEEAYQDLVLDSWGDKKFTLQQLEDKINYYKHKITRSN